LRHYQHLTLLRQELESRAESVLCGNSDYENLKTLPGIGPIIALTILAESGDVRRFRHHRQFLKYCGFDLAKSQSGIHRGREQLSKRGNARLGLAFWLAGQVAVRVRENSFREKYDRYISANPQDADLKRKGADGDRGEDGARSVRDYQEEPAVSAFLRTEFAQWIDPSQQGRWSVVVNEDPVDNAWTFRWVAYIVLGTLKIRSAGRESCFHYG
jgi:hypothetical protein